MLQSQNFVVFLQSFGFKFYDCHGKDSIWHPFPNKRSYSNKYIHIGVRAPLDLRGRSPCCPKNLHNARKRVLYKRTQTAVKTKTFTFLKSNERIFIPKLQLNPNFWNPQRKRKLVRKIEDFEKSGVTKITVFD